MIHAVIAWKILGRDFQRCTGLGTLTQAKGCESGNNPHHHEILPFIFFPIPFKIRFPYAGMLFSEQ
jgi:hypothetical protein